MSATDHTLTDAERSWGAMLAGTRYFTEHDVTRILASRLATAEAEMDDWKTECLRWRDEAEVGSFDHLVSRAEAAEGTLLGLVAEADELIKTWVRDEDEGVEHVVGCQDYQCRECVVIACATDLRALINTAGGR